MKSASEMTTQDIRDATQSVALSSPMPRAPSPPAVPSVSRDQLQTTREYASQSQPQSQPQ
jgi:hypothetical protein